MNALVTIENLEVLDAGQSSVAELGQRIHGYMKTIEQHAKGATECAIEAGLLLIEAKSQVRHGEWEQWLSDFCSMAPRTARAYMRLAKELPKLPDAKRRAVADLPIREALKAIATDPTPPVKHTPTRRLNTLEERERVAAVFTKARSNLAKAARAIGYGLPIKGSEVVRLRKHLEAALEQLNELQCDGAPLALEVQA